MSNIGSVMTINLRGGGNWRTSGLWYGYERDITSRSKYVTRIGNADLHRSSPIQNKIARAVLKLDGTLNYWLHPNNSLLRWDNGLPAKLDGTDGNLMLWKPGFYFRGELDGNKYCKMYSEVPLPGFTYMKPEWVSWANGTFDNINDRAAAVCSLVFDQNGNVARGENGLPLFTANAAQFRGGNNNAALDGAATSMLGQSRTNVTKAVVRQKARNAGLHFGLYDAFSQLAGLCTLEYANYDAQEAYNPTLDANGFKQGGLGAGPLVDSAEWNDFNSYYGFIPEGVTAKLGNKTGVVDYVIKNWGGAGVDKTVQVGSWHGLEKWFAYQWGMVDDLLIFHQSGENGLSKAYVCSDPALFADPVNDSLPDMPAGYIERALLPRVSGYGLNESINQPGDMLISQIGGSANEGTCDYIYIPPDLAGHYQALLFAAATFGAHGGPRSARTTYRRTHADASIGFRLGRKTESGAV